MFQIPSFTVWNVIYTSLGAAGFWMYARRSNPEISMVSKLVEFLPVEGKLKRFVEFTVFVAMGCVVGIGVTSPTNATQALTAGFAWSNVFVVRSTR